MTEVSDSTQAEFWTSRCLAGRTPWDFQGVPDALGSFLTRTTERGRVLIPGCGAGYEVAAFHEAGFEVIALDFSPAAVEQAQRNLGSLGKCVHFGDFFTFNSEGRFDIVYERTFLCSMPPSRWPRYANRMAELLDRGGRLVGIFWYGQESAPPPYPLSDGQEAQLFGGNFRLTHSEPVSDSLAIFQGKERWQEWIRV